MVVALAALSDPVPWFTTKFMIAPLCGAPLLTTRAVNGMLTLAPCATHRYGVVTPMPDAGEIATSVVATDCVGL